MPRNLTTQDVTWFLDMNEKNQLNLDPPYQRRSVWSPKDKRYFIDTIMNNYPAPPVFLHKTIDDKGRATYHVVDGKQRIQTIIDFTNNRIRIPDEFSDIGLQKKKWKDLDKTARERFWNYALIVEMLPDVTDSSIRNIFERINRNSRKLMPQEMRHAKYDGWFISTVEAESDKQEWKDFGLSTASRMKRMSDVQFLSELFSLVIRREIQGIDQDALDELYAEFEDLSEKDNFIADDFLAEVERIKLYIKQMVDVEVGLKDYLKFQNHFYTLWGYVALERNRLLAPSDVALNYKEFLDYVQIYDGNTSISETHANEYNRAIQYYSMSSRGASTELPQRVKRHKALLMALHGIESESNEDN